MTTSNDNHDKRVQSDAWGQGRENSVGVPIDGFQDPTGEYPKRDYFFGSSINLAARGGMVNTLAYSGGELNVSFDMAPQRPSSYPLNQVNETSSGHVVEYDDTPGGERVLIKHRTGSGVEMRADGTVIISSTNNRIEVNGGDNTTIVEGNGTLIYKGNLDLKVDGDFNVDVGGDYNVKVAGSVNNEIAEDLRTNVGKTSSESVRGNKDTRVAESYSTVTLGERVDAVKGNQHLLVQGQAEYCAGNDLILTSETVAAVSARDTVITGANISVTGASGTIGGEEVAHFGKTFSGMDGNDTTFYGSLIGLALEATTAEFAHYAKEAHASYYADLANEANNAVNAFEATSEGGTSTIVAKRSVTSSSMSTEPTYHLNMDWIQHVPGIIPTAGTVGTILLMSQLGIRNVQVDDQDETLKNKLLRIDDYGNVFDRAPTDDEVRHKMRDPVNRNNSELTATLIAEGRLHHTYTNAVPSKNGRISGAEPSASFGLTPLGNNPLDNKSKRFKPVR